MCTTMLAPMVVSPALADTILSPTPGADGPSAAAQAAMEARCDLVAASNDTHNGDRWSGEVVPGAATLVAGPTETPGTRSNQSNVQPAGTHVLGSIAYPGSVYRVGGSVNLFAVQVMTGDYWTDSTYEYDADFVSRFSYAYDCAVSSETFHPGGTTPLEGYYTNNGTNPSGNEGSCQGLSPANPNWGSDLGNCEWHKTGGGETTAPSYDDPIVVATLPQTPIEESQTDNLHGYEDHGGPTTPAPSHSNGQVVVCNSPTGATKGNPGSWKAQNGYGGANCNTAYFNSASWGAGTDTSQGTYISVPMN
jgi:hypothetical protein